MLRSPLKSLCYALAGLLLAVRMERNLRLFLGIYVLIILLAFALRVSLQGWLTLLVAGGAFLSIELLNTALERLSDVLDDHAKHELTTAQHRLLKAVKDIAAAASLIFGILALAVVLLIFWQTFSAPPGVPP
jgi:diacylglycerol kinase